MVTIEQIINSFTFQFIVGAIIGGVIYTIGFHSGNRFRLSRLNLRDPKEIRIKINSLNNDINIYNVRIENEYQKENPRNEFIIDCAEYIDELEYKRQALYWIIKENDNL